MSGDRDRLLRLLGGAELATLRRRLRARCARGSPQDEFTLSRLSARERRALEGLLGRRSRQAGSMRVSLAELSAALSGAGVAASLREALEILDGAIPNLKAAHAALESAWTDAFAGAAVPELVDWLAAPGRRGLVKRLARGEPAVGKRLIESANRVLARLIDRSPSRDDPQDAALLQLQRSRSQLAAQSLGDAHGLDAGAPVATLVLTVLRRESDPRPRDTWARYGVVVNELAAPVLTFNLLAADATLSGQLLRAAYLSCEPLHLSLRRLLRQPPDWQVADRTVFVCENPEIVAIAADRLGTGCAPIVCTDGMPAAAQRTLLTQLAVAGARLRYHGDFDWPGLAIGNFIVRSFGAQVWRFSARDYMASVDASVAATVDVRPLQGAMVAASWDPDLAPEMTQRAMAIDEEAAVESLLQDLSV